MPPNSNKIPHDKLAFDIDGVIADTFRVFVEMARYDYGIHIIYEEITEYEMAGLPNMNKEIADELIHRLLSFPVEMGIQPIAGAMEVLTRLSFLGRVLLITARPEKNSIVDWLNLHLKEADKNSFHIEATGTGREKIPIIRKYGVEYFVEDRLETCYLLNDTEVKPIVFDQPWNRKPHPFSTVKNWQEISAMIAW